MTRINVIPVQELHNKHLLGEYKEITRVYAITRKNQRDILGGHKAIPSAYTLGTGHVLHFCNKLQYITERYQQLIQEMLDRGYKPNPINIKDLLDGIDPKMYNQYVPTDEAIKINRQRINERLKQMESRGAK